MKHYEDGLYLSYKDVTQIVDNLFAPLLRWPPKLPCSYKMFTHPPCMIVALGRGGFVPGVHLSHQTNIPLEPMMWQTRDGGGGTYLGPLDEALREGKHVVIIDDINDTGRTFRQVMNEYDPNGIYENQILTMALVEKASSDFKCDVTGLRINDQRWIYFPWERQW